MNSENPADTEALRNEIQAAIAAGRELSPDMDQHLADSALERYRTEQQARAKALATQQPAAVPAPVQHASTPSIERIVLGVACLAAVVAIVAFTHQIWFLFLLPWLFGGWLGYGRWRGPHGGSRYEVRDMQRQQRIQRMRSELTQLPDNTVHYD